MTVPTSASTQQLPLVSWSRYLDQLEDWYAENLGPEWVPTVKEMKALLSTGDSIGQMMQVTGEEGISLKITWFTRRRCSLTWFTYSKMLR